MTAIRVFLSRLIGLFGRRRLDRRLREEMEVHLQALADDYVRQGLSPVEARQAARRAFGAVESISEAYREQRGLPGVQALEQDVRSACRLVRKRPGFAALAVTVLALGIGVSTTFFTLVNAICLRGLPIERPDDVLFLRTASVQGQTAGLSHSDVQGLRTEVASFEGIAAYADGPVVLSDDDQAAQRVAGTWISAGAFGLLGWAPALGREFAADDDRAGAPAVVVLSHQVWSSRYGSDPSILGRLVKLGGTPAAVVGVMPDGFRFPANADVWMPLASRARASTDPPSARRLSAFGRLKADRTQAHANAELGALDGRLAQADPGRRGVRTIAAPINDQFNGDVTDTVWLAFLTAGTLVLLVACANVANLLLMNGATRRREMATRAAIGATRGRLVRQLLIECALLSAAGSAAGLFLSVIATRALARAVPAAAPLPFWIEFSVDGRVLAVLVAVTVSCVFTCGLWPAWHASNVRLPVALRAGGRGAGSTARLRRSTAWLLTVEIALSLVLLANMAMSVRAAVEDQLADEVIDLSSLLTATVTLPSTSYDTAARREAFFVDVERGMHAIDGVAAAAVASHLPPSGDARTAAIEGRPDGDGPRPPVQVTHVSDRYFDTLGVPIIRGRPFRSTDGTPGQSTVIVNERFADRHFPDEDAVGRRIRLLAPDVTGDPGSWLTIVGVSSDVRRRTSQTAPPAAYLPYRSAPPGTAALLLRTGDRDPAAVAGVLREVVRAIDTQLPLDRLMPLTELIHQTQWNGRVSATLAYAIALIAFALALVGLFAVTAYRVGRQTPEIGLRMALGAEPQQIAALVLRGAMRHLIAGLVVGLALTYAFDYLFVPPTASLVDPIVVVPLVFVIAGLALAACALPALRASRIDPAVALKCD